MEVHNAICPRENESETNKRARGKEVKEVRCVCVSRPFIRFTRRSETPTSDEARVGALCRLLDVCSKDPE